MRTKCTYFNRVTGFILLILFLCVTGSAYGADLRLSQKPALTAAKKNEWVLVQQDLSKQVAVIQKKRPQLKGVMLQLQKELNRSDLLVKKAFRMVEVSPSRQELQELVGAIEESQTSLDKLFEQIQSVRDSRQEYADTYEDFDEKASQYFQTVSSVLKALKEMYNSTVRNFQ